MGYIDSHAHLCCKDFENEFDQLFDKFKESNIERVMIVCCDKSDLLKALKHQGTNDKFDIAYGFHPSDINKINDNDIDELEQYLSNNKIAALGEIGLDYYWDKENIDKQKEYFIKQIKLANKLDLPMIIHSRDAALDTYDILKEYDKNGKGIIHCYSSSYQMAQMFIKLGYLISLAGPVTFKNALVPKDVAKNIDLKNLLIETDSPYLTPHPNRGKRNDSSNVVYIAQMIAELKEIDVLEVMEQTTKNYYDLFNTKK